MPCLVLVTDHCYSCKMTHAHGVFPSISLGSDVGHFYLVYLTQETASLPRRQFLRALVPQPLLISVPLCHFFRFSENRWSEIIRMSKSTSQTTLPPEAEHSPETPPPEAEHSPETPPPEAEHSPETLVHYSICNCKYGSVPIDTIQTTLYLESQKLASSVKQFPCCVPTTQGFTHSAADCKEPKLNQDKNLDSFLEEITKGAEREVRVAIHDGIKQKGEITTSALQAALPGYTSLIEILVEKLPCINKTNDGYRHDEPCRETLRLDTGLIRTFLNALAVT